MTDITIKQDDNTYRLTLDADTEDGSVRVYWNCNGRPVQSGWEGLPMSVRVDALLVLVNA